MSLRFLGICVSSLPISWNHWHYVELNVLE
jgi:hypothetical protein